MDAAQAETAKHTPGPTHTASWRNTTEHDRVVAEMATKGLAKIGVYGGIGPFGGSEVGVFVRPDDAPEWQRPYLRAAIAKAEGGAA